MSDAASQHDAHADPTRCENCDAALQGEFCHQCGQSVHNPIRHAAHAVEEFFEAFWHLDGRLWRTLRDLVSPGRTAINYLAGHRQRYIAPLRLFVVLSLLTFFIGAATMHFDDATVSTDGIDTIAAATTVAEVEKARDELVAEIEQARVEAGNTPGVDPALVAAEVRIRGAAANRIVELGGTPDKNDVATADTSPSQPWRSGLQFNMLGHHGVWDPETNPLVVGWWPDFANAWLNRKAGNIDRNMESESFASAEFWVQGMMASAPTALFLLVPVFALLLKIFYLFTRRLYLEHLVVALYSHAFLLLALTVLFLLSLLGGWLANAPVWIGIVIATASAAMMIWMPVYLLLMQKRVYRQGWWLTVPKYLAIGMVYFMMLLFATIIAFLARLAGS
ncbi:DUF3667 domain-containing protein [Lysobacter sp. F6437]|uniref:DUF3667 domain-containing protein n=1 Tax=Lysobacter sp. F6437 TaxID=3459296 RepID=UPI00403E0FAD